MRSSTSDEIAAAMGKNASDAMRRPAGLSTKGVVIAHIARIQPRAAGVLCDSMRST